MAPRFEWHPLKDWANRRKHGVSFAEAATAFLDDDALLLHDPDPAYEEDRFLLLGLSQTARLLVVCHCIRGTDEAVRIISARKATRHERRMYEDRTA